MPPHEQEFRLAHPAMSLRLIFHERFLPYALYLLVTGICWQGYAFRIGPDMISYVSIAQEYFAGRWWDAVNTFWSPLFSWMIAAGLATHLRAYTLVRCLTVIWGLVGLTGIRRLTLQCGLPHDLSAGVVVIAAPILASFAVSLPSPDFVSVCLLTLYLSATCTSSPNSYRFGLVTGTIGALLYLTKAYMFWFVVAHITFMSILRFSLSVRGMGRWKIVDNYLAAIACFLALSSPWLVLMSLKAGHPTVSATGTWNYAKARMDPKWFPQLTEGLFAPPTPASVSIWEDPGRMHIPLWSPLTSTGSVRWQIYLVFKNCLYFLYFTFRASVFSIVILPYFVWALWRRIRGTQFFYSWACLLSAFVIYPLGYILIELGEQRYVWIESILLLLMGACVASVIREHLTSWRRFVAITTIIAGLSFWCDPLGYLLYHCGEGRDLHSLAESLRQLKLSGTVASNGQWGDTLYLCYELGLHYYGIPMKQNSADAKQELRNNRINYFFVWNDPSDPVSFLRRLRQLLPRSHQLPVLVTSIQQPQRNENVDTLIGTRQRATMVPEERSSVVPDARSQQGHLQQEGQIRTGDAAAGVEVGVGLDLAVRRRLRIYQLSADNK